MWIFVLAAIALLVALFYAGRTWLGWALPVAVLLGGWWFTGPTAPLVVSLLSGLFVVVALFTGVRPLRRATITPPILRMMKPILPRMSETERIALEAGTVWWESELFSGAPDWRKLHDFKPEPLSERELAFLDGPVEEVCRMVDDYDVVQQNDLRPEVWKFLKKEGFFGMIIPESYGGLGFSAAAHSAVVTKLATRSVTLTVTVMVPNSLGPAELLLHFGTEEQKDHYLPRLAHGEDIPCFALTEPGAGSDAGAMQSTGVVAKGTYEGKEVLGIRLNWDKRYITLSAVATVIGLAFKLYDPDELLGHREELDITCALIPTDLPGIEIGERHDPGAPFINGPTRGRDVFVPIDSIIGGRKMAGQGWMMLMHSLAAGRGVSLPSMSSGAVQLVTRVTGAYATVRKQFNTSIGKFEGIEEPLARIGGMTYLMNAARVLTAGAVDAGEKPSVVSAIVKCYLTEGMRDVTNDGMDILAGAGICRGPRNILANGYGAVPIGITVEGANILTRSMIIFGQGALRCHPHVQGEMQGALNDDLALFDRSFFGHVGFVFRNLARSFVLGLTRGALASAPVSGPTAKYYRRLSRMSASFAVVADFAMGTLGGTLKRREKITGRLADVLSWMYLASATLHRFEAEGRKAWAIPYASWGCEHALYEAQEALRGVLRNLPLRPAAWLLSAAVFPLGPRMKPPSDRLGHKVAGGLVDGRDPREELTRLVYVPPSEELGLGVLEATLDKVVRAQAIHRKLKEATRLKKLERKPARTLIDRALEAGVINEEERRLLDEAEAARAEAVAVDAFKPVEYAEAMF